MHLQLGLCFTWVCCIYFPFTDWWWCTSFPARFKGVFPFKHLIFRCNETTHEQTHIHDETLHTHKCRLRESVCHKGAVPFDVRMFVYFVVWRLISAHDFLSWAATWIFFVFSLEIKYTLYIKYRINKMVKTLFLDYLGLVNALVNSVLLFVFM